MGSRAHAVYAASHTSSGSFPPSEVTFHVPRANLSIRGSGRQGLHLRPPPNPLCTGSSRFPLQVVGPLGDGLASLVWAWPRRVPQGATLPPGALRRVPTPGLAPGWDPGSAVLGDVTCLDFVLHIAAANGYVQAAELLLLEGGARVDLRDSDGWQPLHAAACWGQMHVAELLVSHGANLNVKTFLEETPIDLCEDEEFRAILLDLKHKHDTIMKSQLKHKTSLCRRTSSAGSRGKVVRRASLSDRHNLCRKEYETEAIVWRGGREEEKEKEPDQENNQVKPVITVELSEKPKLPTILKDVSVKQNGLVTTTTSMPLQMPSNGSTPTSNESFVVTSQLSQEEVAPKERAQTLSELKKQRAAAKLLNHPLFNGYLGNGSTDSFSDAKVYSEDPRMPLVSSNGNAVYYTPASGDPPLLKFKQPLEEEQPKARTCCCVS
ncbi:hypothetical protein CHARACLAT_022266 [Characodon lateralis]|uniref:Protein phosphatase 1 regulatory inhibitor subunit 16B n=1 Tax=Characodon lateralis TaxID=208331 RepID=A0ABU7ELK3_9TELE|nr:hypothetical protein [Characodon lateralis]